jgi:DNA-binding CsgD family transcriptional regulator
MPLSAWAPAFEAARTLGPAVAWRRRLAEETRRAAGASFALVMTCVPGRLHQNQFDADPPDFEHLREEVVVGQAAPRRHGVVVAPLDEESIRLPPGFVEEYRRALQLHGILGYVVGFLATEQGQPLGSICLGSASDSASFVEEVRAPLSELVSIAAATASGALALARGFEPPENPQLGSLRFLTGRERQIAELLCAGLSDLNIASRLTISEHTVGTHVMRIYRKLGVHSRSALIARLAPILGAP